MPVPAHNHSINDVPVGWGESKLVDAGALESSVGASYVGFDNATTDLNATTVQGAIAEIAGQIAAEFVFNPDAPANDGNIYNNFADLYAALVATPVDGITRIVIVRTVGITDIPAGVYNFDGVEFVGRQNGAEKVRLNFLDGAISITPPLAFRNLAVQFFTVSAPFCTLPNDQGGIIFDNSSVELDGTAAFPAFAVTGGSTLFRIRATGESSLDGSGLGVGLFDVAAGIGLSLRAYAEDAASINVEFSNIGAGSTVEATQVGALATVATTQLGAGTYVFNGNFDPTASAASWAPPAPETLQDAITRLAIAVSGILGGPIP